LIETGERSAVLKTYIVFEPENARAGDAGERTEFVREKFSWPALFFAPLWLLFNRLWLGIHAKLPARALSERERLFK
jgi:hypothetical protein